MTWEIELLRTNIGFSLRDMVVVNVKGRFNKMSGTIDLDEEDPTRSSFVVQVDVSSIDTGNERRDGDLLGPGYFDAENFPIMTYRSRRIERDGGRYQIVGDLTLKGVTKEVVLKADFAGVATDSRGRIRAGFSAETVINRKDFEVSRSIPPGEVDNVGDSVKISLEVAAIKQEESGGEADQVLHDHHHGA